MNRLTPDETTKEMIQAGLPAIIARRSFLIFQNAVILHLFMKTHETACIVLLISKTMHVVRSKGYCFIADTLLYAILYFVRLLFEISKRIVVFSFLSQVHQDLFIFWNVCFE